MQPVHDLVDPHAPTDLGVVERAVAVRPWWREWELGLLLLLAACFYTIRVTDLSIRGEESRRGRIAWEIWHSGDYPVVWTNQKYKMIYVNMGHNDLDFNLHPNKELSFTLENEAQNRLIVDSLLWLGGRKLQ